MQNLMIARHIVWPIWLKKHFFAIFWHFMAFLSLETYLSFDFWLKFGMRMALVLDKLYAKLGATSPKRLAVAWLKNHFLHFFGIFWVFLSQETYLSFDF